MPLAPLAAQNMTSAEKRSETVQKGPFVGTTWKDRESCQKSTAIVHRTGAEAASGVSNGSSSDAIHVHHLTH